MNKYIVVTTEYDTVYSIRKKTFIRSIFIDCFSCFSTDVEEIKRLAIEKLESINRKGKVVVEFSLDI